MITVRGLGMADIGDSCNRHLRAQENTEHAYIGTRHAHTELPLALDGRGGLVPHGSAAGKRECLPRRKEADGPHVEGILAEGVLQCVTFAR